MRVYKRIDDPHYDVPRDPNTRCNCRWDTGNPPTGVDALSHELVGAIYKKDFDQVKNLIELGADPTHNDYSAVSVALTLNCHEIVDYLLSQCPSYLWIVCQQNSDLKMADILAKHGLDINKPCYSSDRRFHFERLGFVHTGFTALSQAILYSNVEQVEKYLELGAIATDVDLLTSVVIHARYMDDWCNPIWDEINDIVKMLLNSREFEREEIELAITAFEDYHEDDSDRDINHGALAMLKGALEKFK